MILKYPEDLDLNLLLAQLECLSQAKYNINIRHFSGSSYSLDLAKVVEVMSRLDQARKLDDFGEHRLSKAADWLDCIVDDDSSSDPMVCNDFPDKAHVRLAIHVLLTRRSQGTIDRVEQHA